MRATQEIKDLRETYGFIMFEGKEIVLTEQAYFDSVIGRYTAIDDGYQTWEGWVDCNGDLHQYKAHGVDLEGNEYIVSWGVINPLAEEESDCCDWNDYVDVQECEP